MRVPERWERELLDWTAPGADGESVSPDQAVRLLEAESQAEADEAFFALDGLVCRSGMTFAAGLPVTQLLLAGLPSAFPAARERCLELLGQIAAGVSPPERPDVTMRCREELQRATWWLLNGLQFDDVKRDWLYVDLIGLVAESYPAFRPRAILYLERAQGRAAPTKRDAVIRNTIAWLRSLDGNP